MIYLLLTVLLNTLLFAMFKIFSKYGIDNLQAIVTNYFVCIITGSFVLGEFPSPARYVQEPWFPWALLMGAMFVSIFNLIAWRTVKDGMTTTTIANKLSLVIPVIFSVFLYGETLNAVKIIGILLALPAVYLTAHAKGDGQKAASIFWPTLLFVASGLLDTLVKFVEASFLSDKASQTALTIYCFGTAFIIGSIVIAVLRLRNSITLQWKNVLAGVLLGVPNYFSIYFLIRFLNSGYMDSSAAIPVNNIGIVLTSSLAAIFFFRERATAQRIFGLILSIVSIILIALADIYG